MQQNPASFAFDFYPKGACNIWLRYAKWRHGSLYMYTFENIYRIPCIMESSKGLKKKNPTSQSFCRISRSQKGWKLKEWQRGQEEQAVSLCCSFQTFFYPYQLPVDQNIIDVCIYFIEPCYFKMLLPTCMYIFITCDQYVLYRETVSYMYILSENKNNARCLFNKFSYLFF